MAKIVSVHSFRGGTGKSNVTANLACTVAQSGHRVGIVDTDVQSPGIHVLFGVESDELRPTLNDFLWGQCSITKAAHDMTEAVKKQNERSPEPGAVFLVPSSMKTGDIARVVREGYEVAALNDGFHYLIADLNLDYLFIDTHPGVNEETLLSIALSDVLLLILRPDKQDFQGMSVTVELARKLDTGRMLLLLNKIPPDVNTVSLREQVERTYRAPVAGIFPLSIEVAQAGSSGVFCLRYPEHPFSREVQVLAKAVMS